MKVWEAIELLQGMNGNSEVTVTMGKPKALKPETPLNVIANGSTAWVIDKDFWPQRNEITCKMH